MPDTLIPPVTLCSLAVGASARVKAIESSDATGQRLMTMGLMPGVVIRLVQIAPLGDPVAVEFDGRRMSLRRREARCVVLEAPAP